MDHPQPKLTRRKSKNNLKRILSLALLPVMVIGMMVVGAAPQMFNDGADINNNDATSTPGCSERHRRFYDDGSLSGPRAT